MALWVCRRCGCRFAVGLRMCPQCTAEDVTTEEEAEMAKITVAAGPSDAAADAEREGEQPSPGQSSSTSTTKPETPPSEATRSRPASARTTGRSSKKDRTGSSSAPSTDTGQQ